MGSRRTELFDFETPERSPSESFSGRPPEPPANALEAAAARVRRVAELREAVAAGAYRPDAEEVASAMLRSRPRRALFGDDH